MKKKIGLVSALSAVMLLSACGSHDNSSASKLEKKETSATNTEEKIKRVRPRLILIKLIQVTVAQHRQMEFSTLISKNQQRVKQTLYTTIPNLILILILTDLSLRSPNIRSFMLKMLKMSLTVLKARKMDM